MSTDSSKASRTSCGASCTAATSCSIWASDKSSTFKASNTLVASSAVMLANTSGLVANSTACSWLMTGGISTGIVVVVVGFSVVVVTGTVVEVDDVVVEVEVDVVG